MVVEEMPEVSWFEKLLHNAAYHGAASQRKALTRNLLEYKGKLVENYAAGRPSIGSTPEDDKDPSYQAFLKHLKPDKTAYVLEYMKQVTRNILRYEVGVGVPDEREVEERRTLRSPMERKDESPAKKKRNNDMIVYDVDACELPHSEAQPRKILRRAMKKTGNSDQYPILKKPKRGSVDPDFSRFLDNCSVLDGSLVFKHNEGMVVCDVHASELEDSEPPKRRTLKRRKSGSLAQSPVLKKQRKNNEYSFTAELAKGNIDPDYSKLLDNCSVIDGRLVFKHKDGMIVYDASDYDHDESEAQPARRGATKKQAVINERKSTNRPPIENVDPDYVSFMDRSSVVGGCLVYKHGKEVITYDMADLQFDQKKDEESEGDSSDLEIIESPSVSEGTSRGPFMNILAFSETDTELQMKGMASSWESEYKRKIMSVLVRPYDREEHVELLRDIQIRKPIERHVDLRKGRDRSCSRYIEGKSYLDHYPDLKKKLKEFRSDKLISLNLLRGFFFWLQHSVQKESFLPWKDPDCLAVNPSHALQSELFF